MHWDLLAIPLTVVIFLLFAAVALSVVLTLVFGAYCFKQCCCEQNPHNGHGGPDGLASDEPTCMSEASTASNIC
ncbi:hypothetical protein QR680_000511 [Steinernema hermaphroditum]|uniref:Uncharacterized protein n=1 Tax=Steinernema hermaphroditum TaxID=289476 RepID=A0AA39GVL1_9BILA|nr:hypothetical protein QR680_000511 [Steinernema hermaphroditum]